VLFEFVLFDRPAATCAATDVVANDVAFAVVNRMPVCRSMETLLGIVKELSRLGDDVELLLAYVAVCIASLVLVGVEAPLVVDERPVREVLPSTVLRPMADATMSPTAAVDVK